MIITCSACGAKNRVENASSGKQPVCGRCRQPLAFSDKPLTVTDANFSAEIEQSALPVLLDMWAPWCGPCRMIAPAVEQLAKDFAGRAVIGKLNVDENQQTAARFQVRSIPTLLILQQGKEVRRIVGAQSKEALARELQQFV